MENDQKKTENLLRKTIVLQQETISHLTERDAKSISEITRLKQEFEAAVSRRDEKILLLQTSPSRSERNGVSTLPGSSSENIFGASASPTATARTHISSLTASTLYANVREAQTVPFNERKRIAHKLMKDFEKVVAPNPNDPSPLARIKRGLSEQKSCYFVCVTTQGIPSDNNRAERELRHLVIKRKKSFGCKTSKGADALSVLHSVIMSLWRKSKRGFFGSYAEATSGAVA